MKIFYGVKIKDELIAMIKDIAQLELQNVKGRLTNPDNYHLTLKFVGEVKDEDIDNYIDLLRISAEKIDTFSIDLDVVDTFEKKKGNVIWIGSSKKSKEFEKLAKCFDDRQNALPHLTIMKKSDEIIKKEIVSFEILIDEITLFESKRVDDKLCYLPIYSEKLKQL
ncbi:MAG: RNA 2',3'-cyclic phosphodiesterase [Bacillota bacterium]|nr:RNA 2',3'-cyclic phosphodiesterase [Bacillota bacterium]